MKKIVLIYVILDLIIAVICSFFGFINFLNSQIAAILSLFILFASFQGYKKQIQTKLLNQQENIPHEDVLHEEKDNDKTNENDEKISFSKYEIFTAFKPYRLFSYVIFVLAVLYLMKLGYFRPYSFLFGISLMPIGTILLILFSKDSK